MKKMKISFIIPVYNVEKYLRQCIESILEQDYEEKEIILVDDGSPDNSGKICDEYAEKYQNIVVIHKQNGGLSDARNTGLMNSTGDYVLFVDSDDFIEKASLKHIAAVVNENQVDVVFLEARKYYEDGTMVPLGDGVTKTMVYKKSRDEVLRSLSYCPKYPASACTKLIRRALITNDVFFKKGLLSEDLDWSMKLLLKAESFDYCDAIYYNYRQNRAGSITNTVSLKKIEDMLYILEKWSEIAVRKETAAKVFILSQMAYELPIIIWSYAKLISEERSSVKRRIKKLLFLLDYRAEAKYKMTKMLCKVCGVDFTSSIINAAYRK